MNNISINPSIEAFSTEKEMTVISHVHADSPAPSDRAVLLRTLVGRLTDAWSRRVARAYADARLVDVTPDDSRMWGELQAVASHQRA